MFNFGIIGPGRIAHEFAQSIMAMEGACIYAVASHNEKKATEFAEKYSAQKVFSDYASLAKCTEVDAVYIGTINPYHHEPSILCLNHKKPVLCEKPLALNYNFTKNMIDAARKNNTFFMEAMWTRFLPAVAEIQKWIEEGYIGDVRMVKADFCVNGNPDPNERWLSLKKGGGALLDLGIYPLSFATMILGTKYESICTVGHLHPTGVDEQCAILLKYPEGQIAQISCSLTAGQQNKAVIMGTKGYIDILNFWGANNARLVIGRETVKEIEYDYEGAAYRYEAEEVIKCISQGRLQSDTITWKESLEIMKIIDIAKNDIGLRYPQE